MNWMKFRPLYFLLSATALTFAIYGIINFGFKYSIDFTGGSVTQYKLDKGIDKNKTVNFLKQNDSGNSFVELNVVDNKNIEVKFKPDFDQKKAQDLTLTMEKELGEEIELVRFETVGPSLSQEIINKTYVAILIASLGILFWVAYQFKSLMFGVSAILAMIHDSIILLGTFAWLGHLKGVEVDILFVTAMLTILSFSVHDTIVVYDRIRESLKRSHGIPMLDLANKALGETMVRSVNNSLTIIFMLSALFLMGGESIKWFIFALLIGTISGTYSSPFVAVPLLVSWEEIRKKLRRKS